MAGSSGSHRGTRLLALSCGITPRTPVSPGGNPGVRIQQGRNSPSQHKYVAERADLKAVDKVDRHTPGDLFTNRVFNAFLPI